MTYKEYLDIAKKHTTMQELVQYWSEEYKDKIGSLVSDTECPCLRVEPSNYDKTAFEKLFNMLYEAYQFTKTHIKELEAEWNKIEEKYYSSEAREIENHIEEYEYEEKEKFWNKYFSHRAKTEVEDTDEEQDEDEDYSYPEDKSWEDYTRTEILGLRSYC